MLDEVRWTVRDSKRAGSPTIVNVVVSGSDAEDGPAMSRTSPGVTTRFMSMS